MWDAPVAVSEARIEGIPDCGAMRESLPGRTNGAPRDDLGQTYP